MIQQRLDKLEARKSFFEENPMNAFAEKNEQPIRFAGYDLGPKSHICGFFAIQKKNIGSLLSFIKEGFDRGERCSMWSIRNSAGTTCNVSNLPE
jgi:hypothetical protein